MPEGGRCYFGVLRGRGLRQFASSAAFRLRGVGLEFSEQPIGRMSSRRSEQCESQTVTYIEVNKEEKSLRRMVTPTRDDIPVLCNEQILDRPQCRLNVAGRFGVPRCFVTTVWPFYHEGFGRILFAGEYFARQWAFVNGAICSGANAVGRFIKLARGEDSPLSFQRAELRRHSVLCPNSLRGLPRSRSAGIVSNCAHSHCRLSLLSFAVLRPRGMRCMR